MFDRSILARLDSNQDYQDQNLGCYRYTTGYREPCLRDQVGLPLASPSASGGRIRKGCPALFPRLKLMDRAGFQPAPVRAVAS